MKISKVELMGNLIRLDIPRNLSKQYAMINKSNEVFVLKQEEKDEFGTFLKIEHIPDYGMYALADVTDDNTVDYIENDGTLSVLFDEESSKEWKESLNHKYFIQSRRPSLSEKNSEIVVLEANVQQGKSILDIKIPKKIQLLNAEILIQNQDNRHIIQKLPHRENGQDVLIDFSDFKSELGDKWFIYLVLEGTKYRLYSPKASVSKRLYDKNFLVKKQKNEFLWAYFSINSRLAVKTITDADSKIISNSKYYGVHFEQKSISINLPKGTKSCTLILRSKLNTVSSEKLEINNDFLTVSTETLYQLLSNHYFFEHEFEMFVKHDQASYALPLISTEVPRNNLFKITADGTVIYNFTPKISVIIPAYNVGHYLPQAVESVVKQSYGFQNIELIIMNDASADDTSEIMHKLKDMYPSIVLVDNSVNRGVSAVRNDALKVFTGEYVTFLDGDDYYTENYLANLLKAMQDKDVNFARAQHLFFGKRDGEHITNKYYDKQNTKVVDLDNFNMENAFINGVLFKKSFVGNVTFSENQKTSEDVKFLWEILNKNHDYKMALVHNAYYMYRKREEGGSAIDTRDENISSFGDRFINVYEYLFDDAEKNNNGVIPASLQTTALYDIGWTLRVQNFPGEESELVRFKNSIKRLINRMDLKTFVKMETFDKWRLDTMLGFRSNITNELINYKEKNKFYYELDNMFITGSNKQTFKLNQFSYENGILTINAILDGLKTFNYDRLQMKIGNQYFNATEFKDFYEYKQRKYWNNTISLNRPLYVKFEIPISENLMNQPIKVLLNDANVWINTTGNSKLSRKIKFNFVSFGHFSVVFDSGKYYFSNKTYAELNYLEGKSLDEKSRIQREEALALRKFIDKPIWLISDRFDKANDNGEAMFRYLMNFGPKDKTYYYVISKNSSDFSRLQQEFGDVIVDIYSDQYEIYKAVAEVELLAYLFNPTLRLPAVHLRNITNTKYVFLQHGVSEKVNPKFFTHFDYDLDMFVTSLTQEKEVISNLDNGYMISPDRVVNTMMPRFDERYSNEKKNILIFLTWRKYLVPNANKNGTRDYNENFKDSDYYNAIINVLNSQKLATLTEKYGYKIQLYLHPELQWQLPDFVNKKYENSVEILPANSNFNKMIAEASMVITDFSSIHFDFAYLRKPVIYYQFDKEEFLNKHTADDIWFDYEKMGFGPVVNSQEKLEKEIKTYLEIGMKNSQKYLDRIHKTFPYFDKNSSRRVYEAVIEMLKE